ncbi:MAG: hypothetical protein IJ716_14070 [Lachnospiraceae bacterium]|nr:hypothetical protein [Lachnospiraceae bacterium]
MKELMKFKDFKKLVVQDIREHYEEDCDIKEQEVLKNNSKVLFGISICRKDRKLGPTVYLDNYYEIYRMGKPFQSVLQQLHTVIDRELEAAVGFDFDIENFQNYEKIKERIVFRLVNAAKNKKLLQQIPHIMFCDLAICFAVYLQDKKIGSRSILIYNKHAETWNVTAEELCARALENTPKLLPPDMRNIGELLEEFDGYRGGIDELPMYVLTNKIRCMGASAILYPDILKEVAAEWKTDIVLFPSSIHEWIAVPGREVDSTDRAREIVHEVNRVCVNPEEVLSENVYLYSADTGEVRIAA